MKKEEKVRNLRCIIYHTRYCKFKLILKTYREWKVMEVK